MVDLLTEFAAWGRDAPFIARRPQFDFHAAVMPVRCKTGIVTARTGSIAHLEDGVAVIFRRGKARYGARFTCGAYTTDAVILPNTDTHGGICELCEDAAKGPCVYRCFNAAGDLLYIGSTEFFLRRVKSHESRTPWWAEVADIKVQRIPTIFEARAAERLAIHAEDPPKNVIHRRKRRSA